MLIVPIKSLASQTSTVQLSGQTTQINIYQKGTGLFVDIYVDNELVIGGVIAQNFNWIVRYDYLGFLGDLVFYDTQGNDDPVYTGLGTRWILYYLTPAEVAAFVGTA